MFYIFSIMGLYILNKVQQTTEIVSVTIDMQYFEIKQNEPVNRLSFSDVLSMTNAWTTATSNVAKELTHLSLMKLEAFSMSRVGRS